MEGAIRAGKWRGHDMMFVIKLRDAAQRKATAVHGTCKTKTACCVDIKTKITLGGERGSILGTFMNSKAKLIKIKVCVSCILGAELHFLQAN